MRKGLTIFIALIFGFSLFFAADIDKRSDVKNKFNFRTLNRAPADKLAGSLRDLVEVYKRYGEINELNVANYYIHRFNEIAKKFGGPTKPYLKT